MAQQGVVWCGVVWCGVVWCGVTACVLMQMSVILILVVAVMPSALCRRLKVVGSSGGVRSRSASAERLGSGTRRPPKPSPASTRLSGGENFEFTLTIC